jgi:hypothetical protein
MENIIKNNKIYVNNDKKEIIFSIEVNDHTIEFVNNWYFLNKYNNKEHYRNSFKVKYQ